jgi:prophage regulatory protein
MADTAEFSRAPALLRLPEVIRKTGYKRSTLYAMVQDHRFPAPIQLGPRAVAWASNEVDGWIHERIANGRRAAEIRRIVGGAAG